MNILENSDIVYVKIVVPIKIRFNYSVGPQLYI